MEFERNESSTRILYGREPYRGVYLSVYDQRLSYKDEMPWDVKKAVKKFGSTADRSGAYFDLRTGPTGDGSKVTMDEIAIYLKRYGAENEHIVKLVGLEIAHSVGALPVMKDATMTTNTGQSEITARLLKQHHAAIYAKKKGDENNQLLANTENVQPPPADSVQQAHVVNEPKPPSLSPPIVIWCCRCEKPSSVICGPCQANRHRNTFYCSRECQKADWKKHRPFCGLQFPEKMPVIFKDRSPVFALLFPENERRPKLVEISLPLTLSVVTSLGLLNSCHVIERDTELYKADPGYALIRRLLGEGPYADAVFCRHPEPNPESYDEDVQALFQKKLAIPGPIDHLLNAQQEKVVRFRLFFRLDHHSDDRSNLNQCILSVTGGEIRHPWAGPVLAFKLIGVKNPSVAEYVRDFLSPFGYCDVELADGRDMVDYFKRPGGPAYDRNKLEDFTRRYNL